MRVYSGCDLAREEGDRPDFHGPGIGRGLGHSLKHMTLGAYLIKGSPRAQWTFLSADHPKNTLLKISARPLGVRN